jgi:hypothetical protein
VQRFRVRGAGAGAGAEVERCRGAEVQVQVRSCSRWCTDAGMQRHRGGSDRCIAGAEVHGAGVALGAEQVQRCSAEVQRCREAEVQRCAGAGAGEVVK